MQPKNRNLEVRPPAMASSLDLRTWLAGCAMANPNVVTASNLDEAAVQALNAADSMLRALQNKLPSQESMRSPSRAAMARWESNLAKMGERNELQVRDTLPAKRLFSEATEELRRASEENVEAVRPPTSPVPKSPGFYSIHGNNA